MKEKEMKQADLVAKSCLPKTTISRICRNSNDKGGTYTPTRRCVIAIGLAFKLSPAETREQLINAAFPEEAYYDYFLDNRLDVDKANIILDEIGLAPLTNIEE